MNKIIFQHSGPLNDRSVTKCINLTTASLYFFENILQTLFPVQEDNYENKTEQKYN